MPVCVFVGACACEGSCCVRLHLRCPLTTFLALCSQRHGFVRLPLHQLETDLGMLRGPLRVLLWCRYEHRPPVLRFLMVQAAFA